MEFTDLKRKPFKVAKEDKLFKGIVVSCLEELKVRCISIFGFIVHSTLDVNVVLAEDGTLIDDEEYFGLLPENTYLIVRSKEQEKVATSFDSTDGKLETSESQETFIKTPLATIPSQVIKKLNNMSISEAMISLMTLSNEELEWILDSNISIFHKFLKVSEDELRIFYSTAEKELLRRNELTQANQLLHLYQRAKDSLDLVDSVKRKR
ncbi:DNA fragmentation factor subunit alpha [Hydra vulgaris]|uniref:DNAation factor subunit alpha n=1 Tax=Hydra vulgaris TaxID=6087 RepID=A0ABM4BJA8_HYDVU